MGYNRAKKKMKKLFFLLLFVASIGFSAKAQCNDFKVTNATPSINGTTVTITVTVEPTFTPSETGEYKVVVKPTGRLTNILDSQSKSVEFSSVPYGSVKKWSVRTKTVEFKCSVNDNSYNQCNSNSFYVSDCWKK